MTGQSRAESLIETTLNIGSGFVLSYLTWAFVVTPLFGIPFEPLQGLGITSLFTVVSIARSYLWRRIFNHLLVTRLAQLAR